jgi:DNA polymerase I-like protein with 3'-5' exonuclease and polymerase domains
VRSLIRPEPGQALAYVDWSQQELGIAAALSRDPLMMEAYKSGDFYLTFAKMAGAVPPDATKKSHPKEREQYKTVALGVMFGLSAEGIARKLGVPTCHGRELLAAHQRTFRRFWQWSNGTEERAVLTGKLVAAFGWSLTVGREINPRSVRNFPMQANGAEMMRIAACLATERGIRVCCPVHDAFLIEADAGSIDAEAVRMQAIMREASEVVLTGFPLGTDVKIVRYPERYSDKRGEQMWALVMNILQELAGEEVCPW